jgi:hypothetical protein
MLSPPLLGMLGSMSCANTHVLSTSFFWSLCQQAAIVLTIDGIHTLVDVVIVDSTCSNLVSRVSSSQEVVMRKWS